MTIPEAIELLTELHKGIDLDALPDHAAAAQLGIEALKAVDQQRAHGFVTIPRLLPGETKE